MGKRFSIARRMTFSISGIVILVAALALLVNYYLAVQNAQTSLNDRADSYLRNIIRSLEVPLWHYDEKTIQHIGSAYAMDSSVVVLQISSEKNERYLDVQKPTDADLIVRAGNVLHDERLVGFVRIALTPEYNRESTSRLLWSSVAIILLVVVTLLIGTRLILDLFLRKPLADISAVANAYAGSMTPAFENVDEYEEFQGLMSAMKEMDNQIQLQIAELQRSEDKFRKMTNFSPYPMCLIDEQMKISYINEKFRDTYGYKLEEVARFEDWWQLAFQDYDLQEVADTAAEMFLEAVKEGRPIELSERKLSCKNGERKPVEISMVNIGNMLLVHMIDLTQRNKMRELIVQTEKMVSVGGLAAGMAHEINNPLSAVMQGAQNVIRRLSADMPKNRKIAEKHGVDLDKLVGYMEERDILKHLQGVRDAGGRAAQIILNMLKFSRKSESNLAPVKIETVLESAIEMAGRDYDLTQKFDFKHIKLIKEYDPSLDIVICTETEIEQVILNLLKNAAQALKESDKPEQPRITLRTKRFENCAQIEVEDNGPGMPDEERKRIFEPFYTTKPVGQGTGLGLSVSYMIITNNHSGTLTVESTPGEGTCFIIRIPLEIKIQT